MAKRDAFTLIEVMVSVMIITTVVMALYSMNGNSAFIYEKTLNSGKYTGYLSFLVGNNTYGFEDDSLDLERLVDDFDIEDDLRRKLKDTQIKISYHETTTIDLSEFDMQDLPDEMQEDSKQEEQNNAIFEIGKTMLHFEDQTASITRIRTP